MKVAIATRADKNNMHLFDMFKNSVKKFHPEIEVLLWDEEKIATYKDPIFFYRASPIIGKEILKDYDLILLMDCDQIMLGRIDHILEGDYDIGTVLNVNRYDPTRYGLITFQGVQPNQYYNNGLVAIRNNENGKRFLDEWDRLCHTEYFHRLQYREQDVLNILCHYGEYNVLCFDDYDVPGGNYTWNGLVSFGEWARSEMRGLDVVIPKGEDNYPDRDITLKIIHWGGGADKVKGNYRIYFNPEVTHYIDWLVSDTDKAYEKDKNTPQL